MSKKELESFRLKAFIIKICFFALMLALIIIFVFSVRIKSVTVEGNAVSAEENIIAAANLFEISIMVIPSAKSHEAN